MNGDFILIIPFLLPVIAGILIAVLSVFRDRKMSGLFCIAVSLAELLLVLLLSGKNYELTLFSLKEDLQFVLKPDRMSTLFAVLSSVMWLMASVFSMRYFEHDKDMRAYNVFFIMSIGVINALCLAGNLLTMYLFYELMTLALLPLVMHEKTKQSTHAGYEFLFYSIGGAFLGLIGFFLIYSAGIDMTFHAGGNMLAYKDKILDGVNAIRDNALVEVRAVWTAEGAEMRMLAGVFCMIVGFGSKAGLFPLHGWLPVAHPVAPAPASALLSGNVTKMGALFLIRIIYYVFGVNYLKGTWVQYAFLILTLITVLMGSVIASREKILKKRLAYSTVSQVSYALFGVALMNPVAMLGALMHIIFHSAVKNTLFLSAGAMIHETGFTRTDELTGIGKKMPITAWCYTLVSITLVGIPPTSAFLSKWYLAQGALESGISVIEYLGPVVLLISAVFTAAYLLSVTVRGFLPGRDEKGNLLQFERIKEAPVMWVPMVILTVATIGLGCFPNGLMSFLQSICDSLFM